jgi:hypothetical protein
MDQEIDLKHPPPNFADSVPIQLADRSKRELEI